jgi:hypothetical protein
LGPAKAGHYALAEAGHHALAEAGHYALAEAGHYERRGKERKTRANHR